jgi:hypothetical protein
MTKRCASRANRNCLVRFSKNPPPRNSRLRSQGQTRGSRTPSHPNRCHRRNPKNSSPPRQARGRTWNPRVNNRKHPLHHLVPRARPARHYQHDLARSTAQRSLEPLDRQITLKLYEGAASRGMATRLLTPARILCRSCNPLLFPQHRENCCSQTRGKILLRPL